MAETAYPADEFPHIDYQVTSTGKLARIAGTRLRVFDIVMIWRGLDEDVDELSRMYSVDRPLVDEALAYARRYPAEIEEALRFTREFTYEQLKAILPNVQLHEFRDDAPRL